MKYHDLTFGTDIETEEAPSIGPQPEAEEDPKLEEARRLWEQYEAYRRRTSRQ
jgi:hypothetical protein